jgi:hypothetical protein
MIQSYFTTDGLPPISSSWRPSPMRFTASNILFSTETCSHSPNVTSSLKRGWVCLLQWLLALASAFILRSQSRGTLNHISVSQIRDSPNLEGQGPVFLSPRNGDPVIPPGTQESQSYFTTGGLPQISSSWRQAP